jgi:hypothetical protein
MVLVKLSDFTSNDTTSPEASLVDLSDELSGFLSYSYLCGAGSSSETRLIEMPESRLRSLLKVVLNFVDVDEAWYLKTNPDVANAVKTGDLASARSHYIIAGFYEDRWPYQIVVDETWYQSEYPDVKTAIGRGSVESCQDHFNRYGFIEGRLPSMGWSLLTRRPAGV